MAGFPFHSHRWGPGATDLILNAFYRGQVAAPPTSIWLSLGSGTADNDVTELSGMTRIERLCNRGEFGGTDSAGYPYPSSFNAAAQVTLVRDLYLKLPTTGVTPTASHYLMAFNASTGGSLYFSLKLSTTTFGSTIYPSAYGQYFNGDIIHIPAGTPLFLAQNARLGNWPYGIMIDYLLRGIDTFTAYFNISTYASTFMAFGGNFSQVYGWNDGVSVNQNVPYVAMPRNTTTWSAPADYATTSFPYKMRKITNLVTLTSGAATAPSGTANAAGYGMYSVHMSNAPQAFDDTWYAWMDTTTGQLTWSTGDTISFAPGAIEIVMG